MCSARGSRDFRRRPILCVDHELREMSLSLAGQRLLQNRLLRDGTAGSRQSHGRRDRDRRVSQMLLVDAFARLIVQSRRTKATTFAESSSPAAAGVSARGAFAPRDAARASADLNVADGRRPSTLAANSATPLCRRCVLACEIWQLSCASHRPCIRAWSSEALTLSGHPAGHAPGCAEDHLD